jgi:hypothetical protein
MQQRTCLRMAQGIGVVILLGLGCAIAAPAPKEEAMKPLEANTTFLKAVDPRLPALARNPKLFTILHQEANFLDEETYKKIRRVSLIQASLPLPALFKSDGTTIPFEAMAVCIEDRRIFVRGQHEGANVLGWVPLVTPDFLPRLSEAVLVFTPVKDGKGKFLKVWGERRLADVKRQEKTRKVELGTDSVQTNVENPKEWQSWLNQLLKEAIGHELGSTTLLTVGEQGLELRGTLKTKIGTHEVRARAEGDTFALTVRLYPNEVENVRVRPSVKKFQKDDRQYLPPDWPPGRSFAPPVPPPAPEK